MQVQPTPAPAAGPAPQAAPDTGATSLPQPALTPNSYGIPDQVVRTRAAGAADRQSADMYAAVQNFYNASIGDDLRLAGDSSQPADHRLLHAGIAGVTVLTLAGGPESLGLKLAAKEILKGGVQQMTYYALKSVGEQTGKLILQGDVRLTSDELRIGAELAGRGKEVIAKPASGIGRSADFLINGKSTELKTISKLKSNSVENGTKKIIKKATKQASNVLIDARNQRGLTESKARRAVQNAIDETSKSALSNVQFLGHDGKDFFEFTMDRAEYGRL